MIAALFVATGGVYYGLPDVDPWDQARDARLYTGPWPVVAHPPCERWGRYWNGGPSAKTPRELGADDGCFAAALRAVRIWGGVLEHPEASHAWRKHDLIPPKRGGGWSLADGIGSDAGFMPGWTCCVEQGHYGHPARKATWLYACGVELPRLQWGPARGRRRLEEGFHSKESARAARRDPNWKPRNRLSSYECLATPILFRDLLLDMARSAQQGTLIPMVAVER